MKLDDRLISDVAGNCDSICVGKESQDVKQMNVTSSNEPDIVILMHTAVTRLFNYLEQLHL